MNRLSRNIPLFYAYYALNHFILDRGIWMLFLAAKGFSLAEIGLIESLYHIVVFICEVPTGYLADRFGKKNSLLVSQVLGIAASALLAAGHSPAVVIAGFMLGGLAGTLQSGATGALVYETLKLQGKQAQFVKLNSRLNAVLLVSMGISGPIGGMLSDVRWDWLYAGKAVLHALSILVLAASIEPELAHDDSGSQERRLRSSFSFLRQMGEIVRFMRGSLPFTALASFGAVVYSMQWSIVFYGQLVFQQYGLTNQAIGTVNGLETWLSAAIAAAAYAIQQMLGKRGAVAAAGFGLIAALLAFAYATGAYATAALFFAMAMLVSFLEPLLETYLHELVPSPLRATMLSVFNMMVSTGMIITFSSIGAIGNSSGVAEAIRIVAIVWTPLAAVLTVWAIRTGCGTSTEKSGTPEPES